jgi:hypothetical protein
MSARGWWWVYKDYPYLRANVPDMKASINGPLYTVLFGLYRLLRAPKGLMRDSECNPARYQWERSSYKVA